MPEPAQQSSNRTTRFDSITRRFVLALALIPIVPASSTIATFIAEKSLPPSSGSFDGTWWFHLFFTVLWMAGFILVWRTAVIWTLGRTTLTALVSFIPFVQVVFNKPLWSSKGGCINFNDMILQVGQHQTSCGIWTWLVVWVWWAMEKKSMAKQNGSSGKVRTRSPWLARLGASMGIFPIIFGLFLIISVFLDTVLKMPWAASSIIWTYLPCSILVFVAWCTIWKRAVDWSGLVFLNTCGTWLLFIVCPVFCQFFSLSGVTPFVEALINCLPIIGWGVWMAWTMWYWPMRVEAGVTDGPKCMKCGYSLRGLTATRCPECGDEPTLDQLWAASSSAL